MPLHIHLYPAHGETWIVMHDDEHRGEALRTLARWANNKDMTFTWLDAVKMSVEITRPVEVECEGR